MYMYMYIYIFHVQHGALCLPFHALLGLESVELPASHDDGAKVSLVDAHRGHQHSTLPAG